MCRAGSLRTLSASMLLVQIEWPEIRTPRVVIQHRKVRTEEIVEERGKQVHIAGIGRVRRSVPGDACRQKGAVELFWIVQTVARAMVGEQHDHGIGPQFDQVVNSG